MYSKKQRIALIVVTTLSIFFALSLYLEGKLRISEYHQHMLHEVHIHYDEKINDLVKMSGLSLKIISTFLRPYVKNLPEQQSQTLSELLMIHQQELSTLALNEGGVTHLSIYSLSGDLLLDLVEHQENHKHSSLGHNVMLQHALYTHKITYGYDFNAEFQGFKYIAPLNVNGSLIGYLEIVIPFDVILKDIDTTLTSQSSILYKKETMYSSSPHNFSDLPSNTQYSIEKKSLPLFSSLDINGLFTDSLIKTIMNEDGMVYTKIQSNMQSYLLTLIPLYTYNQEFAGILLTHHNESKYLLIVLVQIVKYSGALIVLWFLYFLYCKHLRSEVLLEQYKKIVDMTALVSKTDLHGKITYANDSFVALSGYSRKELIGAPHNIIRAPEMAKENFKNMWAMIQQGKIWQGKITNKKKNDERYTVNSTIIPLKNEYGNIIEYMAIRFDITELEAYRELLEHRLSNTNHDLKHHIALVTQYQNAIEKASAFCRFNPDGVITYVNKTMCLISQCEESELLHQNILASNLVTEKTFKTIFEEIRQGKTWKGVIECNHKKDITCFLDATFSPIFENETLQEIMCISHDVTPIYNLYKEIEDTQKEVIFTMGAIGESRSKETGHHVKRVAEYSRLLAILYGLNSEDAELLKQASPMHDIGKIGIPDAILQKPAKLSDEEWKLMQTHTQLGYDMLKHSSRVIFKTASLVALQHHEKWDGTGYPNQLKENEIHIYGRITAIADVFDALGSERCYKQAWEDEAIFELFKQERGKQFEPKLVDLFLGNIQDFIKIREKLK